MTEADATMTATCSIHRRGRSEPTVATFSRADAEKAGLWGKDGPWKGYPKRMLKMRARAFAARDAVPDVLKGLCPAEEAYDIIDVQGEVIDVPEQSRTEQVKARLAARKAEQPSPEQAGNPPAVPPPAEPPVSGHDEELATQA